jgi:hypothetical protein
MFLGRASLLQRMAMPHLQVVGKTERIRVREADNFIIKQHGHVIEKHESKDG